MSDRPVTQPRVHRTVQERPLAPPEPIATTVVPRVEHVHEELRPVDTVPAEARVADRVRWGAIWAGVVVAVASFVLLQLALFATDLVSFDLNPGDGSSLPAWTAIAAGVAFLLGGLVAGATARWRRLDDGLIQGVTMWAVATIGLAAFSSIAVGNLTSSLGGVLGELAQLRDVLTSGGTGSDAQVENAREVAAQACLLLGITVGASAVGAVLGAKLWPRQRHLEPTVTDADRRA